ncbi:MAG TPA: metalloregulator ArsR/SmtB family transcription factor [Acidobacteriota bacterium]|nr:metalloregulator ArsR/SmtB family transcription factor [Acidobacteriota bacterium]
MSVKTKHHYEARAKVIKAMAHPSRLLIIDALSRGERCVLELTELVGSDISTVSRHLAVMKNAGLVATEKSGTTVNYRLRVPCILNFFGCIESVLKEVAEEGRRAIG